MLFPPLEDELSSRDVNGDSSSSSQVLPQELRDRFSKVRSLLREKISTEDAAGDLKRKQEQAALDTARAVQDEVSRLQNGIAELEDMYLQQQQQQERQQQVVVHDDVHVVGGIHEDDMESDVEDDEEDDGQGAPPPAPLIPPGDYHQNNAGVVVFPELPSLVNAIEPDLDADTTDSRDSSARESSEPFMTNENILCDA